MAQSVAALVSKRRQELDILKLRLDAADPSRILAKGFAMVAVDGKRASAGDFVEGRRVRLTLHDGTVEFTVGEVLEKVVGKKK